MKCLWIFVTVFMIVNFIFIKAWKPDVTLLVNTRQFSWSSERRVFEYNVKEGVNIHCCTEYGSWAQLSFNKTGRGALQASRQSKATTMYLLLDAYRDGTDVTCSVAAGDDTPPATLTVTLALNRNKNPIAYRVNDMIPPLISDTTNKTKVYEYKYHKEENLTLHLVNDNDNCNRSCKVHGTNIPPHLVSGFFRTIKEDLERRNGVYIWNLGRRTISVSCTVACKNQPDSEQVSIQFSHEGPSRGKQKEPVSFSDIVMKYWNQKSFMTHYNVRPFVKKPAVVQAPNNYLHPLLPPEVPPLYYEYDHDEEKISLYDFFLEQQRKINSQIFGKPKHEENEPPATVAATAGAADLHNSTAPPTTSGSWHMLLIAVPACVVAALLAVLLGLALRRCTQTHKQRTLSTDCQNLSSELVEQTPAGAVYQHMYSVPIPKQDRAKNHTTQANVARTQNDTYANINNEPNYFTLQRTDFNYAVLDLPDSNSTKFEPNLEQNYATIQKDMAHELGNKFNSHTSRPTSYVNLQELKHCGGFENNIEMDELEPTYSELSNN